MKSSRVPIYLLESLARSLENYCQCQYMNATIGWFLLTAVHADGQTSDGVQ